MVCTSYLESSPTCQGPGARGSRTWFNGEGRGPPAWSKGLASMVPSLVKGEAAISSVVHTSKGPHKGSFRGDLCSMKGVDQGACPPPLPPQERFRFHGRARCECWLSTGWRQLSSGLPPPSVSGAVLHITKR